MKLSVFQICTKMFSDFIKPLYTTGKTLGDNLHIINEEIFLLLERLSIVIAISDIVILTGLSANCSLEISLLFPDTYSFSLTKPITLYMSLYIYFCSQTHGHY